jgi:hypothetical protein
MAGKSTDINSMTTDLSFITNEKNQGLKDRLKVLIKDTSFFDCLVGYLSTCGFHALYRSLEKTEKIQILIGISTNRQTYDLLDKASKPEQQAIEFSHAETKEDVENLVEQELADSEGNKNVEEGVKKLIEWVRDKKLEVRTYPSQKNTRQTLYYNLLLGRSICRTCDYRLQQFDSFGVH